MHTFRDLMKPGSSGAPSVVPGNADASSVIDRITTSISGLRMPQQDKSLTEAEIKTITSWVADGAKFDGNDPATILTALPASPPANERSVSMHKGVMRLRVGAAAALAIAGAAWSVRVSAAPDDLAKGFANPPHSALPHTWWHWCNGNSSKEGITADLEAMKKAGIGGAQIFNVDVGIPSGTAPFMSDKWREQITHAVKEANRLGIELCIHNCAGWSSSGGPWIKPQYAMQFVVSTEKAVTGPAHFSGKLAQPQARAGYYRDIVVLAFPKPANETGDRKLRIQQIAPKAGYVRGDRIMPDTSATPAGMAIPKSGVIDISSKMAADGTLEWDVPAGEWVVMRMGHTPTGAVCAPAPGEGRGLECDKLSREAMDAHWAGMMATVLKDIGPLAGKTLNNSLIDSYEVGSQNWTPKFRDEFRNRRGYDLLPFLPVITGRVVDSIEVSERFLWDFRRTICDLFAENYFGYFGSLCRKHGMKFSVEGYGNGSFDDIQVGGLADIPMGEFWVGGAAMETTKLAASAAHTHGRPVIGAESFTADNVRGRWLIEPYGIKALGDQVFCNGINRYIFHRYANQPWLNLRPGMTMGPWGTHLERTVTWWNEAGSWLKYVARCQYLLQSGRFVADACYYYGEEGPNTLPDRRSLKPTLPAGYDYDGCDSETLLNHMSTKDGQIVLDSGMSYRVLILPDSLFMTPAAARKIKDLVQAGATVVGPKPMRSSSLAGYPACDDEVKRIGDEVWGGVDGTTTTSHDFGKGHVAWGVKLEGLLAQSAVQPDFEPMSRAGKLMYIHRSTPDADIYFVSNQKYSPVALDCAFRVTGRAPELWHADTGKAEDAPVWQEKDGRTVVNLRLDPAGSVFVIFRKPAAGVRHLLAVAVPSNDPAAPPQPKIVIKRAFYEPANGAPGGADVTAKVADMVAAGDYSIPATNDMFGDPTYNVVKRLRVEFSIDGKTMTRTAGENETLDLVSVPEALSIPTLDLSPATGGAAALAWQPMTVQYSTEQGSKSMVLPKADSFEVAGSWSLRFPPNLGAPPTAKLDHLVSWAEHSEPGVKYFSGTVEYQKEIDLPASLFGKDRAVMLDLGRVKNFAEVTVNGKNLGVLWKAPFRVDVTGVAHPGKNRLVIKVTNLWPNRLIGDEQLPPDVEWRGEQLAKWPDWLVNNQPRPNTGRVTFTTWHFYSKDSQLLESGLLGPVVVRSAKRVLLSP